MILVITFSGVSLRRQSKESSPEQREQSEAGDGDSIGNHSFPSSSESEEGGTSLSEGGSPLYSGTGGQAARKRRRPRAGAIVQTVQAVAL